MYCAAWFSAGVYCAALCCAVLWCSLVSSHRIGSTRYCLVVLHRPFVPLAPPKLPRAVSKEPEFCWSIDALTTRFNTSQCRLFCRPCVCNTVLLATDTCSDGSMSGTAWSAPRTGQTSFCPQLARDAICYAGGMLCLSCVQERFVLCSLMQ